ncbi:LacI family DNA-binding transcriptional regulator [Microbacterium sp. NPDC076911]|uniref:LacI family DNA-binding transcriptional regulator n=1 Tax=Microbacterium sp. NPDC076911 TaxID=3154958 RepID=UPI003442F5FE
MHDEPARTEGVAPRIRARITDVAARAGVSIKTVSRVVNDESGVLPGTRDRVIEAIRELDFIPDVRARALKRGGTDTVGVIIDSISDGFFSAVVSSIEKLALADGLSVLFASTGYEESRERAQLERLMGHRLRGLILAPVGITSDELRDLQGQFPTVCIDRSREGIDSVVVDDFGASLEATRTFIAQGHRRIGFVRGTIGYPTVAARLQGMKSALAGAGIDFDESLVISHEHDSAVVAPVTTLLRRPDAPTAVFCATSLASMATLRAVHNDDVAMPALISFGDFDLASIVNPGISCVDQDPSYIGEAAYRRLIALVGATDAEPQHTVVPTRIVQRGSGETPPRSDLRALRADAPGVAS